MLNDDFVALTIRDESHLTTSLSDFHGLEGEINPWFAPTFLKVTGKLLMTVHLSTHITSRKPKARPW